ncbi:MAG: hypothetical protein WBK48_10000 [Dethiobacteria bacterium]
MKGYLMLHWFDGTLQNKDYGLVTEDEAVKLAAQAIKEHSNVQITWTRVKVEKALL